MASEEWRQEVEEVEVEENQMEAKHCEDTREEKDTQEEKEQNQMQETEEEFDDFLESFEEADEELERLVTPKRRKMHASACSRLDFYNSRPQPTPQPPCDFTLPTRPQRVFTIPIPQGEPTKKRIRIALWID